MTCLRSQSRSLIFCQLGGVHEKVRGQFGGHGAQAQRPLRLFVVRTDGGFSSSLRGISAASWS